MELHFVHQAADVRFAVHGGMITEEEEANPAIAQLSNVAPYDQDTTRQAVAMQSSTRAICCPAIKAKCGSWAL
jgi:carbonic anhydrase